MLRNLFFFSILSLILFPACGDKNGGDGGGIDDESPTSSQITVSDVTKFEGDDQTIFDFKVRLTQASDQAVRVDYNTKDLAAIAGEDYVETSGTLTFDPMITEQIVSVQIVTDTLKEADEDFALELTNPINASFSKDEAIGTIRNDDTYQPPSDCAGYETPISYAGMTLIWSDEFEGNSIDTDTWSHETGNHGWGNQELQNYTTSSNNSFVQDGKLIIEARKTGSNITSARMITANAFDFKYGRVDIRAKLPTGQGLWPALWMLGENFWDIGWPHCGEIDIMELVGHEPNKVHGTIHWQGATAKADYGGSTTLSEGDFIDQFHVFTIRWDSQKIRWYMNDELYHTADITPSTMSEFHNDFFFIFNVAVGGTWPGPPDATTEFPQRMYVDYVRVFQQN